MKKLTFFVSVTAILGLIVYAQSQMGAYIGQTMDSYGKSAAIEGQKNQTITDDNILNSIPTLPEKKQIKPHTQSYAAKNFSELRQNTNQKHQRAMQNMEEASRYGSEIRKKQVVKTTRVQKHSNKKHPSNSKHMIPQTFTMEIDTYKPPEVDNGFLHPSSDVIVIYEQEL